MTGADRDRSSRGRALPSALTAPLVLAALLLAVAPQPAAPHAIVLESIPAADAVLDQPPDHIMLRFNSKIEKRLTRVTLAPADGKAVPLTAMAEPAGVGSEPDRLVFPIWPLSPGKYVLRYRVLSADGHITDGALRFSVTGRR